MVREVASKFFNQEIWGVDLAKNKLYGSIPTSLSEMVNLGFLDLSQNLLNGVIPKSLESLVHLEYINFSYNSLQGEIPDGGPFKKLTAQSFIHNEPLCGTPLPPCVRRRSMAKMILIKCILPVIVSTVLIVACIVLVRRKRKGVESEVESNLSTLRVPRRISYYELVQATNGFSESNLLGRGSFGSVYRGMLSSGKMVAVKVIDLNIEATSRSFDAECNAMRNLRHRNLVEIICSCTNVDFKSLVMEFMSNGSVDKWLYSDNCCLDFTGNRPTDDMFAGELSLKTWISESIPNSVMEVVDSSLIQQHGESVDDILVHISSIFGLALSCCADSPEARINMTDLTASLIKIKTLYIQN